MVELSGTPLRKDNKWVMRPDILPGNVLRTKQASGISKSTLKVAAYILCISQLLGNAISLVFCTFA